MNDAEPVIELLAALSQIHSLDTTNNNTTSVASYTSEPTITASKVATPTT